MLAQVDRIASSTLGLLHRRVIRGSHEIGRCLRRALKHRAILNVGIAGFDHVDKATVTKVSGAYFWIQGAPRAFKLGEETFLQGEIGAASYFFVAVPLHIYRDDLILVAHPSNLYQTERRRFPRSRVDSKSRRVLLYGLPNSPIEAAVVDRSREGIALELPCAFHDPLPSSFILFSGGERLHARVRHAPTTTGARSNRNIRIGASLSTVASSSVVTVERHNEMHEVRHLGPPRRSEPIGHEERQHASFEPVRFQNSRKEEIYGLLDVVGLLSGAVGVVIPPAWGQTKEALSPLALTLIETFSRAGKALAILRYDGTNRRGESFIQPPCRARGLESLRFTFSGAVDDAASAIDYLKCRGVGKIVVVSTSLSSIEVRRALSTAPDGLAGWISLVGVADLQSTLLTVSSGIDFGYGLLKGLRFGRQELLGVPVDIDFTGLDAIKNRLAFIEDARLDMSRINVPVTWYHGRSDAWVDLERVGDLLACGSSQDRKLIELPIGHRLHDGKKALRVFQIVAEEVARMATGQRLAGVSPGRAAISSRKSQEYDRLPPQKQDLASFWHRYLHGEHGAVGMELLCGTEAYRRFMDAQIQALGVRRDDFVVDLGSGLGGFAKHLTLNAACPALVLEIDFLRSALDVSAASRRGVPSEKRVLQVLSNLEKTSTPFLPIGAETVDCVMASLLIGYLQNPLDLLKEARRVLKPGGRVVVSTLHLDSDSSVLYANGIVEYATEEARAGIAHDGTDTFVSRFRSSLNSGARLFNLVDQGQFRFWDGEELVSEMVSCGFSNVSMQTSLGDPPQAVICAADR